MKDYILDLIESVESATGRLLALSEVEAGERPAPGRWSPKEIVGHLIDSASNNHQRFVRAQRQEDLVLPGYDQDAWVEIQRYREAPWRELVELWRLYNLHLARVMESVPEEEGARPRHPHSLHEIGWQTVPEDEPATLDHLMRDYVGHLKHHLGQLGMEGGKVRR